MNSISFDQTENMYVVPSLWDCSHFFFFFFLKKKNNKNAKT